MRTLPLSLAGIVLGVFLAVADYFVSAPVVVFLALTTVSLQILSNLSNELGDALSGTDNERRVGMIYSIQEGDITIPEMKTLVNVMSVVSVIFGTIMIRLSFGSFFSVSSITFYLLGAFAIWAARHYTLGKNPYGYRGLGDLYVFLFFGIATVVGGYYLCTHELVSAKMLLPAAAIGFFSVAVLNVNNIRDMKTDAATRVTVAMRLGEKGSRIYHTILIVLGWAAMFVYCSLRMFSIWHYLFVLALPLFVKHLVGVWKRKDEELDPMLPLLVMSSFLFSILAGIGFVVFLF